MSTPSARVERYYVHTGNVLSAGVADPDPEPVINLPAGSGSLLFIKDLKKFQKKVQRFIMFDELLPV